MALSLDGLINGPQLEGARVRDAAVGGGVSSSSSEMHDVEAGAGPPIVVIGMAWTCVARRRDDEPRQLLKI
ncbi:unnamed protein product, partial [Iphiclides podalirius]